ncbi:MaoC/PaaZ C-terminal domain-containing protein [Kutzneria sp. NPDC052558]|uniref:MaoC/PaaZ C-terminal domain-containing protein n=1 Tax=Kutzneria sp. NPDC052558 TaxID=3364121 RepID=UPI0037C6C89D
MSAVTVGEKLPELRQRITRLDLIRYAAAAGDFNRIHWSDRAAAAAGLPDVIAHGMLTLAVAMRAVTDWAGGLGGVVECTGRFARPVVVPDDEHGAELVVNAVVAEVLADARVRVDITVTCQGQKVLTRSRALVALASPEE